MPRVRSHSAARERPSTGPSSAASTSASLPSRVSAPSSSSAQSSSFHSARTASGAASPVRTVASTVASPGRGELVHERRGAGVEPLRVVHAQQEAAPGELPPRTGQPVRAREQRRERAERDRGGRARRPHPLDGAPVRGRPRDRLGREPRLARPGRSGDHGAARGERLRDAAELVVASHEWPAHTGIVARMADSCTHLDTIEHMEGAEGVDGCPQCMAMGSTWVHLRRCAQCGQVGCCDSSPNKHASAHNRDSGHPIMRSLEPGEDWYWCFEDEVAFRISA